MNSIPSTNDENIEGNKSQFLFGLTKYILRPVKSGLYGFTLVFVVILFVKVLSFTLGINTVFYLDLMDVLLASVGFFFMLLIHILKGFH